MRLAGMSDDQTVRAVAQILRGQDSPDPARAEAAKRWLPPVISFGADDDVAEPIASELEEQIA